MKGSVRSLHELSALRAALERAQREAAEQAAREQAEQARLLRERNLFAASVGRVHSLPAKGTVEPAPLRPAPEPRQRERDEQAALREALSDEFDVESLLDTDEQLSYRRDGLGADIVRKLRRGRWTLQAQIDLHGLRRDDAREQLAAFLRDAVRRGLRCVRVVHGKGNGSPGREPVLKGKVRSWLVQKEEVIAFVQARASDGGHGALIVLLRPTAPLRGAHASRAAPRPFPRARPDGRATFAEPPVLAEAERLDDPAPAVPGADAPAPAPPPFPSKTPPR